MYYSNPYAVKEISKMNLRCQMPISSNHQPSDIMENSRSCSSWSWRGVWADCGRAASASVPCSLQPPRTAHSRSPSTGNNTSRNYHWITTLNRSSEFSIFSSMEVCNFPKSRNKIKLNGCSVEHFCHPQMLCQYNNESLL